MKTKTSRSDLVNCIENKYKAFSRFLEVNRNRTVCPSVRQSVHLSISLLTYRTFLFNILVIDL